MPEEIKEELPEETPKEIPKEKPKADAPTGESQKTPKEKTPKESSQTIDYKQDNERLKKSLEKAGKKIRHLESEPEDLKEIQPQVMSADEIQELVDKKVDERVQGMEKQVLKPQIDVLVNQMTEDPDEREAIKLNYEHRIVPSGNLAEDLENAQALANKRKLTATNSELRRTLASKDGVGQPSPAGQKKEPQAKAPQYAEGTMEFLKRRGAKFDAEKGLYVLPSGTVYEPDEGEQLVSV